jgi:hypothetical protein
VFEGMMRATTNRCVARLATSRCGDTDRPSNFVACFGKDGAVGGITFAQIAVAAGNATAVAADNDTAVAADNDTAVAAGNDTAVATGADDDSALCLCSELQERWQG